MRTIAVLTVALFAAACSSRQAAVDPAPKPAPSSPGEVAIPPDSPKLTQIKVEPVGEAEVPVDEVDAPGKIEVNPNRISRVMTPLAGRITQVFVRLGDAVTEGQPVAAVESPDADSAISAYLQADSALGQMKANLLKAQADLDRNRDLLDHQAVARKEVLNSENALALARSQVSQAEASKEQALRRLQILGLAPGQFGQKITLRAPVSGKVLELSTVPGEFRNDTNAPLMTIADLSVVWIASDVPETALRHVQVGESVEIELSAYPGERFHARVMRIADMVDPATRTVKVRAELQNPGGRLLPEMFGRIRHVVSTRRMTVAPASAVIQSQMGPAVYRETSPGRFLLTKVTTGDRAGDLLGITGGLKPGDRIVTDGVLLLKDN
jgi:cobalt-zinc-cadmium efflux system membrane fusion protein